MPKLSLIPVFLLFAPAAFAQNDSCAALVKLALPHTTITLAQLQPAGSFNLPKPADAGPQAENPFRDLPSFCRIVLNLTPSADSNSAVEVWLPAHNWNRKFLGVGNGGFAGAIDYTDLAADVQQGYAAVASDTGHTGSFIDAEWAIGHPEKVTDFGYRAIHEMTVAGKAITRAYYATAPAYTFFEACSDGGREALMEAQRFPTDYNGILAGAPANNWTGLLTNGTRLDQALLLQPGAWFSSAKLPAIQSAVLAACGSQSGAHDGFVNNPPACHFDPSVLLCKGEETNACLTQPQITALKTLYSSMRSASGSILFPGYSPGGELGENGWGPWILGEAPRQSFLYAFGTRYFADMVYNDPQWKLESFNVDHALADAIRVTAKSVDSTDPDLRPFIRHGGKLILYHGWSDAAIPPTSTIAYYQAVRSAIGAKIEDSAVRLFMVPGMQHCGGGPGPNHFGQDGFVLPSGDAQHNIHLALEAWVEKGTAPQTIIATKYDAAHKPVMTRPLCAWPQIATYKGTGDPNDAASFACTAPTH
ncbi:MAG: tannase/feruloyl esterase family alpha/beta hydrolase [Acidobacteriaceae bacterium]